MNLKYEAIQDATITLQQCYDKYTVDFITIGIVFLISLLLIFGLTFYLLIQNKAMSVFIKDGKLQEKYQKHKKDNKGLI